MADLPRTQGSSRRAVEPVGASRGPAIPPYSAAARKGRTTRKARPKAAKTVVPGPRSYYVARFTTDDSLLVAYVTSGREKVYICGDEQPWSIDQFIWIRKIKL